MKACGRCQQEKPRESFFSNTRYGWSTVCEDCRKLQQWNKAKKMEQERKSAAMKAAAREVKRKEKEFTKKVRLLEIAHNRFTRLNVAQLKALGKKIEAAGDNPSPKTLAAFQRRQTIQNKTLELLEYQIELLKLGTIPPSIHDLWRPEYGDYPREEGEELDNEDS